MQKNIKNYMWLLVWVIGLLAVGALQGTMTGNDIPTWYAGLQRSPLTPPDYVFGIAWSILYGLIAVCGWIIWNLHGDLADNSIKRLFIVQLIVNWSWTPLFFGMHQVHWALVCILLLDVIVIAIVVRTFKKLKIVAILLAPYLIWILFATYLNYYIWMHN